MSKGNEIISRLGKLRDITCSKDIKGLTAAMFPGTHCPLMGAAMAVKGIKDAVLLVVGTDECTYYTKHMTIHSEEFGGLNGRCVSAVLDSSDVTFGCRKMLDNAVEELVKEYKPSAVFLVSTCVVEIIGDDIEAMADCYTEKYGIPFLSVHTEHFKCENHIPGIERTITACFNIMEKTEKNNSVNIIGQRLGRFEDTELYKLLCENDINIGMQLPCGCTVEEIKKASGAGINIILNPIGLPLAEKMKEKFEISYVFFDKFTNPDKILRAYEKLFKTLDKPVPEKIYEIYKNAKNAETQAAAKLDGITYIYGNTPFDCMEFNQFMVKLGMKPEIIQTVSVDIEKDKEYLDDILAKADPYVTKTANIAPLQYVYDVIHPNLYLGHEFADRLRKKAIAMVRCDRASSMLGFEITEFITKELVRAADESRELKKEI